MAHNIPEKEIQAKKEKWEWQDRSRKEQRGGKNRQSDKTKAGESNIEKNMEGKTPAVLIESIVCFIKYPPDISAQLLKAFWNLTGIITVTAGRHHVLIMSMLSLYHQHFQFFTSVFKSQLGPVKQGETGIGIYSTVKVLSQVVPFKKSFYIFSKNVSYFHN